MKRRNGMRGTLAASALLAFGIFIADRPALAQRAVQSPLMVQVARTKSSGTSQQIGLTITIRNMSQKETEVRLEALFIAENGSRNNREGIYCERKTSATLKAGEMREFETQSDSPGSGYYTYNGIYYYYSSMKVRGYLTRVYADGQLVNVTGSTPSFQKAGWDPKEMARLGYSGPGEEEPRPRTAFREEPPLAPARAETAADREMTRPAAPGKVPELASRILQSGLQRDLVAYFPLDEDPSDGTVRAANRQDFTGTVHGRITSEPGINGSMHFASGSGIDLGSPDEMKIAGQITMSAWVRTDDGTPPRYRSAVFNRSGSGEPGGDMFLRIREGYYQVGVWRGSEEIAKTPVPADDNDTWVHLVGTFDGAAWRIYRNGELMGEQQASRGALAMNGGWCIGANNPGGTRGFGGCVDEVGIWRRALSAQEITALYESSQRRLSAAAKEKRPRTAEVAAAPSSGNDDDDAPSGPARTTAVAKPAEPAPPAYSGPPTWDEAVYQRTAKLYNASVDAYQAYLKNRGNPSALKKVIDDLQACADDFAKIQHGAPSSYDVPGLIVKCNQTIFAIHGTMQANR